MQKLKEIYVCENGQEFANLMKDEHEIEEPVAVTQTLTVINFDGSIYERLNQLEEISRLNGIKQLGITNCCRNFYRADSSRYVHSLIFATEIDRIAQTYGLPRNLAVTAAMYHDTRTTPLSDSVSVAMGLNDQEHLEMLMDNNQKLDKLLEDYSISKSDLVNLIEGKDNTPLGQLVSSKDSIDVDRWSYTVWDSFRMGYDLSQEVGGKFNPFKTMEIVDGQVVFTSPEMVQAFLEKRAFMFENVYKDEKLMAKEAFMPKITHELVKKNLIDERSIFKMVDYQFENIALKECPEMARRMFSMDGFMSFGFIDADPADVENYLNGLTDRPFAVKKHKAVNPATGTLVLKDGDIKPFNDIEPQYSKELSRRMSKWCKTGIYGYEEDRSLEAAVSKAIKHFDGSLTQTMKRNL